ncbi:MAG: arylesterase [Bacteroidota bacterium]
MKHTLSILAILLVFLIFSCKNEAEQQDTPTETQQETSVETPKQTTKKRIVFFGNSLSAGYGLENIDQGFVGLIEKRIDSLELNYEVVNAGLSGETTAGGLSRIDWTIDDPIDVFVLELGGNDALRAIDAQTAMDNLQGIIDKVKSKYPEATIVLAGMQAPRNLGNAYTKSFESIYPKLAAKNDLALIPFLLEDVAAEAALNLPDGIHPNVKGHQIVAENVWEVLEDLL